MIHTSGEHESFRFGLSRIIYLNRLKNFGLGQVGSMNSDGRNQTNPNQPNKVGLGRVGRGSICVCFFLFSFSFSSSYLLRYHLAKFL